MKAAIDRLEATISKWENRYRDEKTLPYQCLTISDTSSYIDETHESWCLGDFDQDSISTYQFELDQSQILNKLASFQLKKIKLDCEYEPDRQLYDSVSIFESMLIPVSLPNLDLIPEPTLIPIPIYLEIEPSILDFHVPLMDHACELKFFDSEQLLNQNRLLNPNMI